MLVNLKKLKSRNKNRVGKGIYIMRGFNQFNFSNLLEHKNIEIEDSFLTYYGVSDNVEQILNYMPELETSKNKYVLGVTKVKRKDQPVYGGWRWDKWGKYIGIQNKRHEYLYDEKEIEEIYFYEIYQVK